MVSSQTLSLSGQLDVLISGRISGYFIVVFVLQLYSDDLFLSFSQFYEDWALLKDQQRFILLANMASGKKSHSKGILHKYYIMY